jgi:hypothetical protein
MVPYRRLYCYPVFDRVVCEIEVVEIEKRYSGRTGFPLDLDHPTLGVWRKSVAHCPTWDRDAEISRIDRDQVAYRLTWQDTDY